MAPEHDEEQPATSGSPDHGGASPDSLTAPPAEPEAKAEEVSEVEPEPIAHTEPESDAESELGLEPDPEPELELEPAPEPEVALEAEPIPVTVGAPRRPAAPRRSPAPARPRASGRPRPPRDRPPTRARRQPDQPVRPAGSPRTKIIVLSFLSVIVLVVVVGALFIGRDAGNKKSVAKPTTNDTTATTLPLSALTVFHDDETGSTISYPAGWERLQAPTRDVRLVASEPGGTAAVLLRVQRTEEATTPANLANLKAVTDGIVGSNNGAQVLKEQAVNSNGLIGFYYLYLFKDKNGLDAVHAHYFLFQGHKMNSIVLEADPGDRFGKLAGVFDQIADSFRSAPEPSDTSTTSG